MATPLATTGGTFTTTLLVNPEVAAQLSPATSNQVVVKLFAGVPAGLSQVRLRTVAKPLLAANWLPAWAAESFDEAGGPLSRCPLAASILPAASAAASAAFCTLRLTR